MKTNNKELPPIIEIYGTLCEVDLDLSDSKGYLGLEYHKENKQALRATIAELQDWIDKDVYIQVRLMTKRATTNVKQEE